MVGIDSSLGAERATEIAFYDASRRGVDVVAVHTCLDDVENVNNEIRLPLDLWLARWPDRSPA